MFDVNMNIATQSQRLTEGDDINLDQELLGNQVLHDNPNNLNFNFEESNHTDDNIRQSEDNDNS